MESLETLFSTFENAEPLQQFVEMAFPYMSEAARARMPHYLAWYLFVAVVCLVMSIVARRRRGESLSRGLECAAITGVAVAFALGAALFSFEDPLRHLAWSLDAFKTLVASAVAHVASLQLLGFVSDVVNVVLVVISAIFWGALAGIPVFSLLLAMRAEFEVYGFSAPIAFVGHSLLCVLVISIWMVLRAVGHSALLFIASPLVMLSLFILVVVYFFLL